MPLFIHRRLDAEGKADGSQYMTCTGSVSRDAKVGEIPKNHVPKVEFGMGYDRKQFMNVCVVGDNAATKSSACLEKGDAVHVVGTWSKRPYTTRNGEEKIWSELRAEEVYLPERLMELQLLPINDLYRLLALLPKLEKLCAGESPAGVSGVTQNAVSQRTAEPQEIDEEESLPWDQDGGDDDYELSI